MERQGGKKMLRLHRCPLSRASCFIMYSMRRFEMFVFAQRTVPPVSVTAHMRFISGKTMLNCFKTMLTCVPFIALWRAFLKIGVQIHARFASKLRGSTSVVLILEVHGSIFGGVFSAGLKQKKRKPTPRNYEKRINPTHTTSEKTPPQAVIHADPLQT